MAMLACLAVFPGLGSAQDFNLSPTFSGHAFALQVTPWRGAPAALVETGPVPSQGGQRQNSMRDTPPIAGVDAHLLFAVTLGTGSRNHSQASLSFLTMKAGSHVVTAIYVGSEATATAEFLHVATRGKSTVQGLMVDGQAVTVTGEPNQTITLPDGYLVINEQTGSSNRRIGTLTVNALHLLVDGEGSVIAGSSTAEVVSGPTPNPGL
jgi:hypothetical protein